MATYVFSDVHGHVKTLDRLLEEVSPTSEDTIWVLGDMIDRGPDPVGVIKVCRSLPNVHVLMGNHEDLMIDYFTNNSDGMAAINWAINGCRTTAVGLEKLPQEERLEILEWVINLPLCAHISVNDRVYLLVHAGLRPHGFTARKCWSDASLDALLKCQTRDDLLWIREDFWGSSTGLLDEEGQGPIVIAGHTPVPYVEQITSDRDRSALNVDGVCQMLHVGALENASGVADKWAIDCGAAGGPEAGWARILMLRLDDGKEFYASVKEGE